MTTTTNNNDNKINQIYRIHVPMIETTKTLTTTMMTTTIQIEAMKITMDRGGKNNNKTTAKTMMTTAR